MLQMITSNCPNSHKPHVTTDYLKLSHLINYVLQLITLDCPNSHQLNVTVDNFKLSQLP